MNCSAHGKLTMEVKNVQEKEKIVSDINGSYTGRPKDGRYEVPVQDADDL